MIFDSVIAFFVSKRIFVVKIALVERRYGKMLIKWLLFYVLCMNVGGFFLMGWDKRQAKKDRWRVPEVRFFLVACLGGSVGCWLGMRKFRHKTKHKQFVIGIPLIFILQVVCFIFAVMRLTSWI